MYVQDKDALYSGVMHMDQIILNKVIGKYGWQFVLVIVMTKFHNMISRKFRKSECIKIGHV